MLCPKCSKESTVFDTRIVGGERYRRRVCPEGHRFPTKETIVDKFPWPQRKRTHKKKPKAKKKKKSNSWLKRVLKKLGAEP